MSADSFTGFPQEGLKFLAGLVENNDRDWFAENKQVYLDNIVDPAVAFVETMGGRLQFISPHIQYDTRTNGQGSLMRIYRDVRFSKDKSPYKSWVGIRFWEGAGKKGDCPGFFLWFEAAASGFYTGMYGFPKKLLKAYREAVVDDELGAELESAIAAVRTAGAYEIGGEHYKKVPRGFDPDHPRADLLKYNAIYASSPRIELNHLTSPGLVDICMDHSENTAPLHRWLVKVNQILG
ncbi:MAG: DUF2461 domain-containing protein, partial [Candidatus Promineifilaceae bacterium]